MHQMKPRCWGKNRARTSNASISMISAAITLAPIISPVSPRTCRIANLPTNAADNSPMPASIAAKFDYEKSDSERLPCHSLLPYF